MDHSVAIEALKDELEETTKQASFLNNGIASMTLRSFGPEKIRKDAILRWESKLATETEKIIALRSSIAFLEQHHTEGN